MSLSMAESGQIIPSWSAWLTRLLVLAWKGGRTKVLSFGCVRDAFEMSYWRRALGGKIFWSSLIFETMYLSWQNAIGQARLILGGDRVLRVDGKPITPPLELWDWAGCKENCPNSQNELFNEFEAPIVDGFLQGSANSLHSNLHARFLLQKIKWPGLPLGVSTLDKKGKRDENLRLGGRCSGACIGVLLVLVSAYNSYSDG